MLLGYQPTDGEASCPLATNQQRLKCFGRSQNSFESHVTLIERQAADGTAPCPWSPTIT